ncbi:uncharacterized protein N7483_008429 [Penicillium malachiteum]|uniref:uncharacterized protein n=1 Tax=Penicillium malachiteum TaxID=1324776 RepID=UPI0025486FAC|nr:uncharacterized protein N7483_008429 [Penicillium malachiteum]KAJ5720495.1 hypothetical protein N7483_008429 [Penicillium malachiteum]
MQKLQKKKKSKKTFFLLLLANALLFCISIALIVFSVLRKPTLTDAQCDRILSPYSPALEAVEYETYTFKNNFSQPSEYRGPPTPEREAAWKKLTHGMASCSRDEIIRKLTENIGPAINVPMEKLYLLNKSTEIDWVRTPEEAGGGAAALLEVVHQLHCLGMLRKWSYREWYEEAPPEFDGPENLMHMHVDHCIEMLRVHLMCASDVTPFLSTVDNDSIIGKRADFESMHKCRNFSKIQEWMWDNLAIP